MFRRKDPQASLFETLMLLPESMSLELQQRLAPGLGTAYTTLWARVVLTDAAGRRVPLLLLRDQFSAEDWRKIQVALRECDNLVRRY